MKKLRWGILGTGRMADWFCSDFHAVPNGTLAAVASRTQSSAGAFAQRYNIPNAYGDYRDMLADTDVDIVYIATPHTTHKPNALSALQAGKHVLCEKPLTTNEADAKVLFTTAESHGQYLMEALWTWHLPAIRVAKTWVDEGRIGKLVHVRAELGYPVAYSPDQREYDAADAGGALREMGVYAIAIGRHFIDPEPLNVKVVHQRAPNGVESDLTALFDYGDMTATLAASYRCRLSNMAQIIGEDGYITIPDAFRCHNAMLHKLDEKIDEYTAPRSERGYHYQAIAAGEDILAGRIHSPIVPPSASIAFQRDMDRILREIEQ